MKKIFKIAAVSYFLFFDFVLFAQVGGPGDDDDNGGNGLEGGDPQQAPINGKLSILILLGIVYSFILIKRNSKQKIQVED
jgi:hypothetical protein